MYEYNRNWSDELKQAEQRRYRAECKVLCLTAALDRTPPEAFDELMRQIEQAQQELHCAGNDKFNCLCQWIDAQNKEGA